MAPKIKSENKEEQCSVKEFINHFTKKGELWEEHITKKKNTFLQTLFLDGIFIKQDLTSTIANDNQFEQIEESKINLF